MNSDHDNSNAPRPARPVAPAGIEAPSPKRSRPQSPNAPLAASRNKTLPRRSNLTLQRTIIPILLTMCVMSLVLAAGWLTLDIDSPFREFGPSTPLILAAVGAVSGVLAGMNMMSIRRRTR